MSTILRGEQGRLHRQQLLQRRPDLAPAGVPAAATSSSSGKAEPAVRGPPPGLKLGAEPDQLMRAVEEAYPESKNEPLEPIAEGSEAVKKAVEDAISSLPSKSASDAAAKATENGGGPKKPSELSQQQQGSAPIPLTLMPPCDMRALLKVQRGLLAVPGDSVRPHLPDVLQRKLAKEMPSCTSLSAEAEGGGGGSGKGKGKGGGGGAAALQAGVEQLRGRFAVAKGRHVVRYAGYDAALELLKLLADRNEPAVTAVLKLNLPGPGALACGTDLTVDGPEGVAVAAGERCKGEFLVSFDVRGVMVKPRSESLIIKTYLYRLLICKFLLLWHAFTGPVGPLAFVLWRPPWPAPAAHNLIIGPDLLPHLFLRLPSSRSVHARALSNYRPCSMHPFCACRGSVPGVRRLRLCPPRGRHAHNDLEGMGHSGPRGCCGGCTRSRGAAKEARCRPHACGPPNAPPRGGRS